MNIRTIQQRVEMNNQIARKGDLALVVGVTWERWAGPAPHNGDVVPVLTDSYIHCSSHSLFQQIRVNEVTRSNGDRVAVATRCLIPIRDPDQQITTEREKPREVA